MASHYMHVMRPGVSPGSCGERFGDYPVALLTRRTFSLQADDMLNQRLSSPGSIRYEHPRRQPGAFHLER